MATGDTAARNSRASDFSADFTTSSLVIKAGATTLATHTLAGFGAPATGVLTASAIADATIAATDTADTATLSDTAGTYTLTVGTVGSGADLELSTLTYISGETSTISSLVVTFPA
tara:strand:- start:327 stop:674 length:348 start_codon:yes stop_codon:yes gene_type:complete